MVRTQIQFEEQQLARLRRRAAEEGISVSALVRRMVEKVDDENPSREELWERASALVGRFNDGAKDVARRHDDYLEEAYLQ